MLKLLLPQGHLQVGVLSLLSKAGIEFTFKDPRDYRPQCSDPRIEAKVLRPQDTPWLLAQGRHDFGFCGLDLLDEKAATGLEGFVECIDTRLNPVKLVLAAHWQDKDILSQSERRLLIATEYPFTAARWAASRGIDALAIPTAGCTEAWVPDDADLILDVTETGTTLRKNGLVVVSQILRSTTHLVASKKAAIDHAWFINLVASAVLQQQA